MFFSVNDFLPSFPLGVVNIIETYVLFYPPSKFLLSSDDNFNSRLSSDDENFVSP